MGEKYYYKDGTVLDYLDSDKVLHREDGPAREWADGDVDYFIKGKYCTREEWERHPEVIKVRFNKVLAKIIL